MPQPANPKAYSTVLITLTAAGTAYNIIAAARAIDPYFPMAPRYLSVQSVNGNTAAGIVLLGDADISATRYGRELLPGGVHIWEHVTLSQMPATGVWAWAITNASQKLAVEAVA